MGSINLYQSTALSLLRSIQSFTKALEQTFQTIFYLAAFFEATTDPDTLELSTRRGHVVTSGNLIDYEDVRIPGGVRIEAKDLAFTYPGADKPTLRNINLIIEPGETLAIVGFNGGGKTTLVKALMGLYEHTGTLLINDREVGSYLPASLHKRTSCLFQDFSRYSLSLRENVGIGNVERMEETELIDAAINRGGAEQVRDKVGLEGGLNKHGVPDVDSLDGKGKEQAEKSKKAGESSSLDGKGQQTVMSKILATFRPTRRSGPIRWDDGRTALSGGEWQRVALSRAFIRSEEADLVVFESVSLTFTPAQILPSIKQNELINCSEPSASLDPRAESNLFQRIHALSNQNGRRITTIYISHRFSTVRKADRIAFVEDGVSGFSSSEMRWR